MLIILIIVCVYILIIHNFTKVEKTNFNNPALPIPIKKYKIIITNIYFNKPTKC